MDILKLIQILKKSLIVFSSVNSTIWTKRTYNTCTYSLMSKKLDSTIVKKSISKKFRKLFFFLSAFYLIICLMKAKKNFENSSHFENTRAGFLLRCQKSLRQNTDFNQYFVVAFDPIKISTHYAPQNDCWNLSFVKEIYVLAKKMT